MTSHPAAAEPARLGSGGEAGALDHHHRARAVGYGADVRRGLGQDVAELGAVGVGEAHVAEHGSVDEGVGASPRAVDQLVADDQLPGMDVGAQRTGGERADHAAHAELAEGPQVGPRVHPVGRVLVVLSVAGEEGDGPVADRRQGHRSRRRTVGGVDGELRDVVEEPVEAAAADHGDLGGGPAHGSETRTRTATTRCSMPPWSRSWRRSWSCPTSSCSPTRRLAVDDLSEDPCRRTPCPTTPCPRTPCRSDALSDDAWTRGRPRAGCRSGRSRCP